MYNKSAGIFRARRRLLPKFFRSKKFKEIVNQAMSGFVAGSIGSAIPTMVTYPIDTQNIRQQSGLPPATTLKDKYKGFDTKMYKTIASIGLTFALAKPLETAIASMGKKKPKTLTAATMIGLAGLAGLGAKVHTNLNKEKSGIGVVTKK